MSKITQIKLEKVYYVPKVLEPGVLYVSDEFSAAVHLCACGCGCKVSTPLGPTEWLFRENNQGPTLRPSVGNWQLPCRSHYWIEGGEIVWYRTWSPEQIEAGRRAEGLRRKAFYEVLAEERSDYRKRFWRWIVRLFR